MRTYLTSLAFAVIFGLVSCGGGNDVASSGATAVSTVASATATATTATESTTAVASPNAITQPKLNGQIDERTGVAPVIAKGEFGKNYCVTCTSCHVPMDKNLSFCHERTYYHQ
jgi:hypothetical protein